MKLSETSARFNPDQEKILKNKLENMFKGFSPEDKHNKEYVIHCNCLLELAKSNLWVFGVVILLFSLLLLLCSKEL